MSWSRFLLGKPKGQRDLAQVEAENVHLRRTCDGFRDKYVRARAHQEQLKDLRRITCDQRIELYRMGKILDAEREFNRRLREELAGLRAAKEK